MKNRIFKLSVLLIVLLLSNNLYSQFYDSEDKIMFYQGVNEEDNDAKVFNFDGNKATDFDDGDPNYNPSTTLGVRNILESNKNYFEDYVYKTKYKLNYRSDLSNSTWVVYSVAGYNQWTGSSWTSYYFFSRDRKTMIYKESSSNNEWRYRLVDKSYFIEEGRRRSR